MKLNNTFNIASTCIESRTIIINGFGHMLSYYHHKLYDILTRNDIKYFHDI